MKQTGVSLHLYFGELVDHQNKIFDFVKPRVFLESYGVLLLKSKYIHICIWLHYMPRNNFRDEKFEHLTSIKYKC